MFKRKKERKKEKHRLTLQETVSYRKSADRKQTI